MIVNTMVTSSLAQPLSHTDTTAQYWLPLHVLTATARTETKRQLFQRWIRLAPAALARLGTRDVSAS